MLFLVLAVCRLILMSELLFDLAVMMGLLVIQNFHHEEYAPSVDWLLTNEFQTETSSSSKVMCLEWMFPYK